MPTNVIVAACRPSQMVVARQLLTSDSAELDRYSFAQAAFDPADILVATQEGVLLGVHHHQLGTGRVGWMWAPVVIDELPPDLSASCVHERLIQAGTHDLLQRGADLVQALLRPGDLRIEAFSECGFRQITDVVQMERELTTMVEAERDSHLEFIPCARASLDDLCQVVKQTYEKSMDCPELDGVRSVADVLHGYRSATEFGDDLWWLVRVAGQYVACVLMGYVSGSAESSLQYMGVVPGCRGYGIGRELTRHAIREATRVGARKLQLGVDTRNEVAWRLYRAMGFAETGRRSVLIYAARWVGVRVINNVR